MSLLLLFNQPPWYRVLLETAKRLISESENEIAVVTAQMACEIYTESVLSAMFAKRGVQYLENSIDDLLPSYNLANDRVRNVTLALSNDKIQETPFWSGFKEGCMRMEQSIAGANH
jgi:hypothetical protein